MRQSCYASLTQGTQITSISVGERWASLKKFGRKTGDSPSLEPDLSSLWEFEGALWLYLTSLALIPLLLHTSHRLRKALRGKETWFRRGGSHALGTPGIVEPLERGRSAQTLRRSMHRSRGRATAVPPAPAWKMGCCSNGRYGLDAEIAVPGSLDCATREIKLDDPF